MWQKTSFVYVDVFWLEMQQTTVVILLLYSELMKVMLGDDQNLAIPSATKISAKV